MFGVPGSAIYVRPAKNSGVRSRNETVGLIVLYSVGKIFEMGSLISETYISAMWISMIFMVRKMENFDFKYLTLFWSVIQKVYLCKPELPPIFFSILCFYHLLLGFLVCFFCIPSFKYN